MSLLRSRRRAVGFGILHEVVSDQVLHQEVTVLDSTHVGRLDDDGVFGQVFQGSSPAAAETHRRQAVVASPAHGLQHVPGRPAAAESQEDVSGIGEVPELFDEDLGVVEIIGQSRDPGDIGWWEVRL